MADVRRIVEQGYDRIADRYLADAREGRGPDSHYRRFFGRVSGLITRGGRILDLGCGAGEPVVREAARWAPVVGVDLSARQLLRARRGAPGAAFVRSDMTEIAFAPGSFDAVLALFSIVHVPREAHAGLFVRIRDWLRPGSLFAGLLGTGDNPRELASDFYGAPMYWSHFDGPTGLEMIRAAGLDVLEAEEVEDEGERFAWVIARGPAT